jgi:hypothetical protein
MTSHIARQRPQMGVKLPRFPASGILYGLAAGFVWGVACGLLRGPFWPVVVGGLAAAALGLWLERAALAQSARGGRRANLALLVAAAYAFLTLVAVGMVSVGYFAGEWLRR